MDDQGIKFSGILLTVQKFINEGKIFEAKKALEVGFLAFPNNPILFSLQGSVYAANKEWRDAINSYTKALDLDPIGHDDNHFPIGFAYYNIGDYQSAIYFLNYWVKKDPANYRARWFLARSYHLAGRNLEALEEYKILEKVYKGEMLASTWFMLGIIYFKLDQFDAAIEEIKKALTIMPNIDEVHYLLGECYKQKGLINEANSEYDIAKKLGYNESKT